MRWWRVRGRKEAASKRAEQEAKLRSASRMTPVYVAMAPVIADLPPEELAERLYRAMTLRSH